MQVFIELELENSVQWRESGLLNLPDHISPGFIPWLEHCRNCRTFSLRASNLLGLSWDQGTTCSCSVQVALFSLLLVTMKPTAASISLSHCRVLGASDLQKSLILASSWTELVTWLLFCLLCVYLIAVSDSWQSR